MTAGSSELPAGLDASWVLRREVPCPRCGYNLTMLREPRCPECGLRFRWQALLQVRCPRCDEPLDDCDEARCPHCRLTLDWPVLLDRAARVPHRHFEYAPRPVGRLWRIVFGVLRPRAFWRDLRLEHPPAVARLWPLLRVAWGVAAAVLAIGWPLMVFAASLLAPGFVTVYPTVVWRSMGFWRLVLMLFGLPAASCVLLPMFRITFGRYRIRGDHLVRVVTYCGVLLLWLYSGLIVAYAALMLLVGWFRGWMRITADAIMIYGLPLVLVYLWLRFYYVALRDYLRLDALDRWAMLTSTHSIALLANLVAGYAWVWFEA